MSDIISLIERVERASGPDRELDAAIDLALFPDHRISGDHILDRMGFGKPIPHYTASHDAVMALMPEGFIFNLGNDTHPCWSDVWNPARENFGANGRGATPSLALLSAILRARQAMEASE